jgi:catechol 2,3-dioxygenase-like lactoylglutathione lyase family enzyme
MTDTSTALGANIQIKAAVPTFLVPDVARTARWYTEHLGFRTAGTFPKQEPYAYASMQRDGAEIMLLRCLDTRSQISQADAQKGIGMRIFG